MSELHSVVNVRFLNPEPMGRSATGRLESVINAICFPKVGGTTLGLSNKEYTYSTDIELKENDIVLVMAGGSLSLAIVCSVNNSTFQGNKVLGKVEFSKVESDRSKILEEIMSTIDSDKLEEAIIDLAKSSGSERIKTLLKSYFDLGDPLSKFRK